ncbi:MAG: histidine phosphatase family protein [Peptostreptococcaceae bacterium]|nr:histidine phosphatase family protein [Peptostreptococcaceae bacterium]
MKLYITRHGETEYNQKHILQGNSDSPLTQKGLDGAKKLADFLEPIPFEKIISSNLGRAVKTAEIIAEKRGQQVIQNPVVAEIGFADWQGKTREEICINEQSERNYRYYFERPDLYRPIKNAESFDSLFSRARTFLSEMKELATRIPDANVLLVTHGAYIKALLAVASNLPLRDFWSGPFISNLSITIFEIDRDNIIVRNNVDVSHLQIENQSMEMSGYLK